MEELTDAMIAVQKQGSQGILKGSTADFRLIIRHVLAEGDIVAVHTQISRSEPSSGGLRQVHLFRFSGDKIVEYWDITKWCLKMHLTHLEHSLKEKIEFTKATIERKLVIVS